MQAEKIWTGPLSGKWLDLHSVVVDPPTDVDILTWEDSSFERDRDLASQGILYTYATSSDGRTWRREILGEEVPGYREVRATPDQQIADKTFMTMDSLLEDAALHEEGLAAAHDFVEVAPGTDLHFTSPHSFDVDGRSWASAQHFMTGMLASCVGNAKAQDLVTFRVGEEPFDGYEDSPAFAEQLFSVILTKARSGKLQRTKKKSAKLRLWVEKRYNAAVRAAFWKARGNPDAGSALLSTGDKILVFTSSSDRNLGAGILPGSDDLTSPSEWSGKNLLGFALMEARRRYRKYVEKYPVDNS